MTLTLLFPSQTWLDCAGYTTHDTRSWFADKYCCAVENAHLPSLE